METIRITEIFYSLQGETKTVGLPTVFVRLTGCPLRCHYCDTAYAFHGGKRMPLQEIIENVTQFQTKYVTVTGGEPLAQKSCLPLLTELCDRGYFVSLETSGALDVSKVDTRVMKVIDLKTPASGEVERNLYENLQFILPHDQIKFVLSDRNDYDWAKLALSHYNLPTKCEILFSPVFGKLPPMDLADWIIADQLPVRFQVQLHKVLWGDTPGR
ncbi:MAG: 7-carboxy-7-deazaguanine synthase [Legionellaceae bacterium]